MRRERADTDLEFSSFCCSSSMLVHWLSLHRFVSGARPSFGAHPKMEAPIFVAGVQTHVFTSSHSAANFLSKQLSHPLLLTSGEGRNIADLGPLRFFSKSLLIMLSFSDWMNYNQCLSPSLVIPVDPISASFLFFSSLSPFPEISLSISL